MSLTTKPSLHDNDALLTYRVGPVLCCGPTLPIVTIRPPPSKLTRPPGTNIAEPGIFKHDSYIVSTTDLRYRFGVKQENWKQPGQVVIAKHDDIARGYFVDEIIDVIHFPKTGWGQLPAYLPRGIFSRTLVINKKIYLYAEFEKLSQLQGSDYLSEYIAQLENQVEKENINKSSPSNPKIKSGQSNSDLNNKEERTPLENNKAKIEMPAAKSTKIDKIQPNKSVALDKQDASTTVPEKKNSLTSEPTPISLTKITIENTASSNPETKSSESSKKHNTTKNISHRHTTTDTEHKKINTQINSGKSIKNKPADNLCKTKIITNNIQKNMSTSIKNNNDQATNTVTTQRTTSANENRITPPISNKESLVENTNTPDVNKKDIATEKDSSSFGLLLLFIILILASGGGYYYLSIPESADDSIKKSDNHTNEYSDSSNDTPIINEDLASISVARPAETVSQDILNDIAPAPPTQNIDTKSQPVVSAIEQKATSNTNQQISNGQNDPENNNTEYHASINQDETTITIELKGPLPPEVINTKQDMANNDETGNVPAEQENEQNSSDSNSENITAIPNNKKRQPSTQQKEIARNNPVEIVHIIVKGDTLWAIAKHYLQNPFLYPELAKLSKIKNPDLIYPGNRVHIIYRHKNKKRVK